MRNGIVKALYFVTGMVFLLVSPSVGLACDICGKSVDFVFDSAVTVCTDQCATSEYSGLFRKFYISKDGLKIFVYSAPKKLKARSFGQWNENGSAGREKYTLSENSVILDTQVENLNIREIIAVTGDSCDYSVVTTIMKESEIKDVGTRIKNENCKVSDGYVFPGLIRETE